MPAHFVFRGLFSALLFLVFACSTASAQSTIGIQISARDATGVSIPLSLEDLDGLSQAEFTTSTIWTDAPTTFSGVPLKALLAHLEVSGTRVEMTALNDYVVSLPVSDLEEDVPIVATRANGEPMSVRDKGPFWIVYPYDSDPKYQTETVYARSIWQLTRLKVMD